MNRFIYPQVHPKKGPFGRVSKKDKDTLELGELYKLNGEQYMQERKLYQEGNAVDNDLYEDGEMTFVGEDKLPDLED